MPNKIGGYDRIQVEETQKPQPHNPYLPLPTGESKRCVQSIKGLADAWQEGCDAGKQAAQRQQERERSEGYGDSPRQ